MSEKLIQMPHGRTTRLNNIFGNRRCEGAYKVRDFSTRMESREIYEWPAIGRTIEVHRESEKVVTIVEQSSPLSPHDSGLEAYEPLRTGHFWSKVFVVHWGMPAVVAYAGPRTQLRTPLKRKVAVKMLQKRKSK